MPIKPGTRIGPYEVTSPLGEGGMGVVFRAHDTKLQRDVALKLLPDHFLDDPDRMLRLQREAQVLASLNHPNIAQIYGLEDAGNTRCIVMELVEGETLAERLSRGPIPLLEALKIAAQITTALEAAHEKTIIHRDLKPANIKFTADGTVKVLDFGLAKAFDNTTCEDPSNSPTLSMAATAGMIMGTAAYMSPEQAAGKPLDKRTDIWSYGAVLFEMLTGERLFAGAETVSYILADVLRAPIDFARLPGSTPPAIRDLLRRCLDRNVKNRLRDIGEARIAIENAEKTSETPMTTAPGRSRPLPWIIAVAAIVVSAVASFSWWRAIKPIEHPLMRLVADLGTEIYLDGTTGPAVAISHDGLRLAYISRSSEGRFPELSTRLLGSSKSTVLLSGESVSAPFFSPDGRWIGFFSGGTLKKISVDGGPSVKLWEVGPTSPRGASWGEDNNILFASQQTPLMRVSSTGGPPLPQPNWIERKAKSPIASGSYCREAKRSYLPRVRIIMRGRTLRSRHRTSKPGNARYSSPVAISADTYRCPAEPAICSMFRRETSLQRRWI